jgi:flagellar motor switch protein FliG
LNSNLRKAAVVIRSLDADTSARLLAQLSPAEAAALGDAVRALGAVDPDEQADVVAELRRTRPVVNESAMRGVELLLSSQPERSIVRPTNERAPLEAPGKRFEFLENAPINTFVSYLAREHAQTIAVVLSHLQPARAADILAALPERTQTQTVERLSVLGETDPESVIAVERELASWIGERRGARADGRQRNEVITSMLLAADAQTRNKILTNLRACGSPVADRLTGIVSSQSQPSNSAPIARESRIRPTTTARENRRTAITRESFESRPLPATARPQPVPRLDFDHLVHLDNRTLSEVLHEVNANALALALAGSTDELIDRICEQMPKRTAKAFRRQLRQLGPTRLSDVESAQRLVAHVAAQKLARRRSNAVAQVH